MIAEYAIILKYHAAKQSLPYAVERQHTNIENVIKTQTTKVNLQLLTYFYER